MKHELTSDRRTTTSATSTLRTILVVDDFLTALLLRIWLERRGCVVEVKTDLKPSEVLQAKHRT
jgi:hypothetical protein